MRIYHVLHSGGPAGGEKGIGHCAPPQIRAQRELLCGGPWAPDSRNGGALAKPGHRGSCCQPEGTSSVSARARGVATEEGALQMLSPAAFLA